MNLRDIQELADQTSRDLEEMRITVRDANRAVSQLDSQIEDAKDDLRRKKNDETYPTKLAQGFIQSMKNSGLLSSILIEMIDLAAEENIEFERTAYKAALYRVAQEKDIYKMFTRGTGWRTVLTPNIVFEEEAGDLDDWAEAVQSFRDDLEVKIGSRRSKKGERATAFWINRVFGTGLEVITINARLGYANGLAPFWRILNNGSQPLASDRPDNSYNPLNSVPTDFIGDAERAIAREFRNLMEPEEERWDQEIDLLQEEIYNAERILESLIDNINKLTPRVRESRNFLDRIKYAIGYADEDVLPKAEQDYRAGEEFSSPKPEDTDVNVVKKAGRFLGGLVKKAIRKVTGYDD